LYNCAFIGVPKVSIKPKSKFSVIPISYYENRPLFGRLISQLGKSSGNAQRLRSGLFWNITQRTSVVQKETELFKLRANQQRERSAVTECS